MKKLLIRLATLVLVLNFVALLPAGEPSRKTIPFDQIGMEAQKQYSGEGFAITATANGAKLKAAFQDLEAEATQEGLWLTSTADEDEGKTVRFLVRAIEIGREGNADMPERLMDVGQVQSTLEAAAFVRAGLIEEYTVNTDGVRQDFVVLERPVGDSDLCITLEVKGARLEEASYGAKLILSGSEREIAYSRLKVTDAKGRELEARMTVTSADRLRLVMNDERFEYPIRIDPTFSDANWIAVSGEANETIHSLAIVGSEIYVGGAFTAIGGVSANYVAKWNGTAWSPLGSGMGGNVQPFVNALLAHEGNLFVGGFFTTAGEVSARFVAKWDGVSWSSLGAGLDGASVYALAAISGKIIAGGMIWGSGGTSFYAPDGRSISGVAQWDGHVWSALAAATNGTVFALAVSGNNLYAGGHFDVAGELPANNIACWNGAVWRPLGPGLSALEPVTVKSIVAAGNDVYAGGYFSMSGSLKVNNVAKWNGLKWSALGNGFNDGVHCLSLAGTHLYAGGSFTSIMGGDACRLARWNGTRWTPMGSATARYINSMFVTLEEIYAAGSKSIPIGIPPGLLVRTALQFESDAPDVSISPGDTILSVGQSITLTAVINDGAAPVTYQWRRNGIAVAKATHSTLPLINIQRGQEGVYDVVAKNAYGVGISNSARLSLPPLVTVSANPTDTEVNPGQPATFTVNVPGATAWQWLKNGVAIKNATTSVLTVPNVDASSVGLYSVTVTTPGGKVTTTAAQLRMNDSGLLIYKLTGTGNAYEVTTATVAALSGYMILDRSRQRGGLILGSKSGSQNIHRLEVHEDLHTQSIGPVPKTQTVVSEMFADEFVLWLNGTDSLLTISKTDKAVGPATLKGYANSLDIGTTVRIETVGLTLAIDATNSTLARQYAETVEQAMARLSQDLQAKGSALVD